MRNSSKSASGVPTGVILLPAGAINYTLPAGSFGITLFDAQNKQALPDLRQEDRTVTVPAGMLQAGKKYLWEMRDNLGVRKGEFQVTGAEKQQEIEARLKDGVISDTDESLALAKAALLFEAGFEYDARRLLK